MTETVKRSSISLNKNVVNEVKKAAFEATVKAGVVIKQSDLINYLIKHHLKDAVEGVAKEKGV